MFDLKRVRELIRRNFQLLTSHSLGHISVPVSRSTKLHLMALAASNGVEVEDMLAKVAEGLADASGRRMGSWEAAPGGMFIAAHGLRPAASLDAVVVYLDGGLVNGFVRFSGRFGACGVNSRRIRTLRPSAN